MEYIACVAWMAGEEQSGEATGGAQYLSIELEEAGLRPQLEEMDVRAAGRIPSLVALKGEKRAVCKEALMEVL